MSCVCWLVVMLAVTPSTDRAIALEKEGSSGISISMEKPKREFPIGGPITITVTFTNSLKRDVKITSFQPEDSPSRWFRSVCARFVDGSSSRATQVFETRTDVDVTRTSGVPKATFVAKPGDHTRDFSFLVKAGASASQSFDLMRTGSGAETITSPGRFKVSLLVRTSEQRANRLETVESHRLSPWTKEALQWLKQFESGNSRLPDLSEGEPLHWEGEARAAPIEIIVVERQTDNRLTRPAR